MPQERVFSLICSIDEVLKNFPFSTARALAKITGKIISTSPIIGNISRLMTRSLHLTIEGRLSWDNPLDLRNNVNIFEELKFWRDNVKILMLGNCLYVFRLDCSPTPTLVMTLVEHLLFRATILFHTRCGPQKN